MRFNAGVSRSYIYKVVLAIICSSSLLGSPAEARRRRRSNDHETDIREPLMILGGTIALLFLPLMISTLYYFVKDPLTPELLREAWKQIKGSFQNRHGAPPSSTETHHQRPYTGFPEKSSSVNTYSQRMIEQMYADEMQDDEDDSNSTRSSESDSSSNSGEAYGTVRRRM